VVVTGPNRVFLSTLHPPFLLLVCLVLLKVFRVHNWVHPTEVWTLCLESQQRLSRLENLDSIIRSSAAALQQLAEVPCDDTGNRLPSRASPPSGLQHSNNLPRSLVMIIVCHLELLPTSGFFTWRARYLVSTLESARSLTIDSRQFSTSAA
jgi:hypothetical protein